MLKRCFLLFFAPAWMLLSDDIIKLKTAANWGLQEPRRIVAMFLCHFVQWDVWWLFYFSLPWSFQLESTHQCWSCRGRSLSSTSWTRCNLHGFWCLSYSPHIVTPIDDGPLDSGSALRQFFLPKCSTTVWNLLATIRLIPSQAGAEEGSRSLDLRWIDLGSWKGSFSSPMSDPTSSSTRAVS